MYLYRITRSAVDETPIYRKHRADAHEVLRRFPPNIWPDARIEKISISPNTDDIVDMLNGSYEYARSTAAYASETFKLGPRGGLEVVGEGE